MTEMKKVYLKFDGRSKRIKFLSAGDDWKSLRDAVFEASAKDELLKERLSRGSTLIFQMEEAKKNGEKILVDVDEDEYPVIQDEDEISVVFVQPEGAASRGSLTSPDTPHSFVSAGEAGGSIETEQIFKANATQFIPLHVEYSEVLLDGSVSQVAVVEPQLAQDQPPQPSRNHSNSSRTRRGTDEVQHLKESFQLPALQNGTLENYVKHNLIVAYQSKFYEYYGCLLRSLVPDHPQTHVGRTNQSDYNIMAKAVCKRHPELSNPQNSERPHASVSRHLSIAVRNQRQGEKKARDAYLPLTSDKTAPAAAEPAVKKRKGVSSAAISLAGTGAQHPDVMSEEMENTARLEQELLNCSHKGLSTHVQRLMRVTFPSRRKQLQELNSGSAAKVVGLMPFLQYPDLISYELSLIGNVPIVDLQSRIESLLAHVGKWRGRPSQTDEDKAALLSLLYKDLKPKRVAKAAPELFMTLEALSRLDKEFEGTEGDAPRLVMYVDSDLKVLCSSFIVADSNIRIHLEKVCVARAVASLMGAYHAWHIGYAPAYRNVLTFLDEHILGIKSKNINITYLDFQREFAKQQQVVSTTATAEPL